MLSNTTIQIFLTDDDTDDHYLFKQTLKETNVNYELTIFDNGKKLIDHLNSGKLKPNILFLDINMPVMNGHECLQKIRFNKTWDSIPIVMFSTSSIEEDIKSAFDNGANLYLAKPIFFKDTVVAIKRIFSQTWQTDIFVKDRSSFVLGGTA